MTTKQEMVDEMWDEHLSLGPHKCLSYLPQYTIRKFIKLSIPESRKEADSRGLNTILFRPGECRIKSGAVYFYCETNMDRLVSEYSDLFRKLKWPDENKWIIKKIAQKYFEEDHPFNGFIRSAFGDNASGR